MQPSIKTLKILGMPRKIRLFLIALFIFVIVFLVYKFIYPDPRNWYDHYLYLAKALLAGHVNLTNLPSFYQDVIIRGNKTYVPFPVGPALTLIPFILLNTLVTQQQVSILLGSVDVALFFLLAKKFTTTKTAFLLSLFLGFGTALFWASVVGTTWYFAHVAAFFFLELALLCHFKKYTIFSGILFSLAVLCRYPILPGVIFFVLELWPDKKRLLKFLVSAAALAPIHFLYSWLRFGDIFQTGYVEVYLTYAKTNYPYTILQVLNPAIHLFGYLDPRNIPLHLFTFLIEQPIITNSLNISPSPYGMGILFTSPLLFLAFKFQFKKGLERNLIIGALAVALIDFLHYMQGWVQFGYRFALDFLPFLLIILAIRFKLTKLTFTLILISVIVTFWGVRQGIILGW